MAEIVRMPKLGWGNLGTLVCWKIVEGDPVLEGSVLAEVETDKVIAEISSPIDGILACHLMEPGSVVAVDIPIAIIRAPDEQVELDPGYKAKIRQDNNAALLNQVAKQSQMGDSTLLNTLQQILRDNYGQR